MEKYRKFADEATGNNPFLPNPLNKPSTGKKVLYYVISRIIKPDSRTRLVGS